MSPLELWAIVFLLIPSAFVGLLVSLVATIRTCRTPRPPDPLEAQQPRLLPPGRL